MYLAVLALVLARLEQSQRETANLKLMQQLAFPAVPVQEPALLEQFQKSNTANPEKVHRTFSSYAWQQKRPACRRVFFIDYTDENRPGKQKSILHN